VEHFQISILELEEATLSNSSGSKRGKIVLPASLMTQDNCMIIE